MTVRTLQPSQLDSSIVTQSELDAAVATVNTSIGGKADMSHTHAEADITNLTSDLAAKAPLASPAFTGTPTGITKTHVGLGNVDNTSDATKNTTARTLTNARITERIVTTASTATLTIDSDATDSQHVTALAADATIAAPTGTPTSGQRLRLRLVDNGTSRALTWNAAWRGVGFQLPPKTTANKTIYIDAAWNAADSKWDVIDVKSDGWISYTPSTTNLGVGNGTLIGKYKIVNGTVFFEVSLRFGTTTALITVNNYTQSPRFTLPVTGVINSWSCTDVLNYGGAVMPGAARTTYDASATTTVSASSMPQWYDANNFCDTSLSASTTSFHDIDDRGVWSGFYEKA